MQCRVPRREFLLGIGAIAAATAVPSFPAARLRAAELLYPPMDLSYFDTPIPAGPSEIHFGYASITWDGNDRQAIEDIASLGFHGIQLRANVLKEFGSAYERQDRAHAELGEIERARPRRRGRIHPDAGKRNPASAGRGTGRATSRGGAELRQFCSGSERERRTQRWRQSANSVFEGTGGCAHIQSQRARTPITGKHLDFLENTESAPESAPRSPRWRALERVGGSFHESAPQPNSGLREFCGPHCALWL